jgi:DNA-binding Lrp family transcriptional regulator
MFEQDTLKPVDMAVAIGLAVEPVEATPTYAEMGARLHLSPSTVHQSVRRLQAAGLLRPGTRQPNRSALREFVTHGLRYAFPPALGPTARGVPTAHSGPPLRDLFDAADALVWPHPGGTMRGASIAPLYPGATSLPERAPEVYRLLTLLDAIRAGRARERNAAIAAFNGAIMEVGGVEPGDV